MKDTPLLTLAVVLIVGGILGWFLGQTPNTTTNTDRSEKAVQLRMNMSKLWEDHITWTRNFLISAANDSADKSTVTARLLKNQEDIGNAIKPYYGSEAGNKLTGLLKTHITTAADLVTAVKAGDSAAGAKANDAWYKNANEIADFLNSANSNWPKDQMRTMMKDHLDLTKQEAVDILGGKFAENVADYDKVHDQILKMADMLSEGIIKQYPSKF